MKSSTEQPTSPEIDRTTPHSARIWNYWLGGKDNFAIDREVGDEFLAIFPQQVEIARESRAFLGRAVRFLVAEAGIRQFLDLGTGIPTAENTHEVAQRIAPESKIVYVDNDPLVLAHARALLVSTPEGATNYIDADLREPDVILEKAAETLDFNKPIALMMLGILGHIPDEDGPEEIVHRLVEPLSSGSYVVINDGTNVLHGQQETEMSADSARARAIRRYVEAGGVPYNLRTPERIEGFFAGLELVEPGVVSTPRWRPELDEAGLAAELDVFCGVARKP